MYALSYVTKVAFDGIRECLGHRKQYVSTLKAWISALEGEVKEKNKKISSQDEIISSLTNEVHDLKGMNEQLAEDVNFL